MDKSLQIKPRLTLEMCKAAMKTAEVRDGVEIVTLPIKKFSYAFEIKGEKFIFLSDKLKDAKREKCIVWGLEVLLKGVPKSSKHLVAIIEGKNARGAVYEN